MSPSLYYLSPCRPPLLHSSSEAKAKSPPFHPQLLIPTANLGNSDHLFATFTIDASIIISIQLSPPCCKIMFRFAFWSSSNRWRLLSKRTNRPRVFYGVILVSVKAFGIDHGFLRRFWEFGGDREMINGLMDFRLCRISGDVRWWTHGSAWVDDRSQSLLMEDNVIPPSY